MFLSSILRQWCQKRWKISAAGHESLWRLYLELPPRWDLPASAPRTLHTGAIRKDEQKLRQCWCPVRTISFNAGDRFPRKMERYTGREVDRDPKSKIHAKFDENFKPLPAPKKSTGEYRQSVVARSTKNIALVPKKWKRAIPCREVVDAVMYLRRAKPNPDAVKEVMQKRVARLLRLELMLVLSELQRLEEPMLAHQVFNAVRKESWYRPNVYFFQTMVQTFGRNGHIKEAEMMFEELRAEGLQPDGSIKRELLRVYVARGMIPKAMNLYKEIQKDGLKKDGLDMAARSILFHGLNAEEKMEISVYEKKQGYDWSCGTDLLRNARR